MWRKTSTFGWYLANLSSNTFFHYSLFVIHYSFNPQNPPFPLFPPRFLRKKGKIFSFFLLSTFSGQENMV